MYGFRRVVLAASLTGMLVGCGPLNDQRGFLDAVAKSPLFDDDSSDKAMTALTRGDFSTAERLAINVLRRDPKDPYALYTAGMVYQATGRFDLAHQYYEVLLANRPQVTITVPSQGGPQVRSLIDVAQANLLVVDKMLGRTVAGSAVRSGRGPEMTPQNYEPMAPQGAARGMVAAEQLGDPAAANTGRGSGQAETNVAARFRILKRLLDEGLITPDEYSKRRNTNVGALLPYSAPMPPAMGLERPGPTDEQVVDRLKALSVALESRALSPAEHGAERLAILDALMPGEPRKIDLPVLPPKDVMEAATAVGRVERMRASGLVSAEEARKEKDAVTRVLDSQLAKQPVSGTATGLRQGAPTNGKNGKNGKTSSGGANNGVSLGTAKTEEAAKATWDKLKAKFPEELGSMEASFRASDQGEKGTRWRIVAGPMAGRDQAVKLCKVLKLYRQSCEATSY